MARSMIRESMDPVHILMDPVHGPSPRRESMDQGSMFCTLPLKMCYGKFGTDYAVTDPYEFFYSTVIYHKLNI